MTDLKVKGPAAKKQGVLKLGLLELDEPVEEEVQVAQATTWSWSLMALWMLVFACCLRGWCWRQTRLPSE